MKLQLSFLILVHFLILIFIPISFSSCHFPAIFNFGDSNSDTGGLSAAYPPLPPPYGMTFFKRPSGRISDGRVIIDFIAESLGLPFLSAYLNSLGSNFSHGANFATSASSIIPSNITLLVGGYSPFFLQLQSSQYLEVKVMSKILRKRGGVFGDLMPKEEYFSHALYTIDIGQNDITQLFEQHIPKETYIPSALGQFSAVFETIYKNGGRYFWIHNTGPLGCLPYVLLRQVPTEAAQFDSAGCSIFFNELAQEFNRELNETVVKLRQKYPKAAIVLVDMYSAKYNLISNAADFGFKHPLLKACCGYGGGDYNFNFDIRCGYSKVVNGTRKAPTTCKNPSKHIIWDGIHFTEAANKIIFNFIKGGKFSDPPVAPNMACRRDSN